VTEFDLQPTVGYRLNPRKLKTAPQGILPFVVGAFYYTEDYEYFDIIKPYLDIPEPRKSLEEIQQELDERFERLVLRTKEKFNNSYDWGCKLERYEKSRKRQDADFEYAKERGQFPPKLTISLGGGVPCASYEQSFVVKQGTEHEGYYTFGNRRYFKYYMPDKPSVVVRFFMKNCLGLSWVDEK
jgi:hypothetical protein